ncbi:MAG: hypothetical protein M3Q97_02930, partial [Bacteroidota bacterium]|nr:hypothetical protein [Bacteroidota bacterium]
MLWINGYTNWALEKLGLNPPSGRGYWANDLQMAAMVMNDWNWMFIDGSSHCLSAAEENFERGYRYAAYNQREIFKHLRLSGNHLQIVAHSQG